MLIGSLGYKEAGLVNGFAYLWTEWVSSAQVTTRLKYVGPIKDIELHCFDKEKNVVLWSVFQRMGEIADMRLSDKDANERKTMNHLHILEPYIPIFRVWKDEIAEMVA